MLLLFLFTATYVKSKIVAFDSETFPGADYSTDDYTVEGGKVTFLDADV